MNDNRKIHTSLAIPFALLLSTDSVAYDRRAHETIASQATATSTLSDLATLKQLGLNLPYNNDAQRFPSPSDRGTNRYRIDQLISRGAVSEDEPGVRVLNHFYRANASGEGLTIPVLGQIGEPSPTWALRDDQIVAVPCNSIFDTTQCYSYRHAREYLYEALTAATAEERVRGIGQTFESLGHVIHHLADMAQPQHVRNDPHLDAGTSPIGDRCAYLTPTICAAYLGYKALRNKSFYEAWTEVLFANAPPRLSGYEAVYSATESGNFNAPRKFWQNFDPQGRPTGIAQFAASNFPSAGTLDTNEPLIGGNGFFDVNIADLCNGAVPPCAPGLSGNVRMYPLPVTDHHRPDLGGPNPYGVSYSMFDEHLDKLPGGRKTYALNRFNYVYPHSYLLPRAVGFSAGLINYFFRGKLEISLPDEGIYAILDHNDPANSDPANGGFVKVRVKLRNLTPSRDAAGNPTIEPMTAGVGGSLRAIAKFRRNNCYKADLSGEMTNDGSANDWRRCRSSAEEIVVSGPVPTPEGINSSARPVTFWFTSNKIPINATDLHLQVVYRGPLGLESNAIVVATKDISEPTYFYNYSRWDQYTYCETCTWPVLGSATTGGAVATSGDRSPTEQALKQSAARHTYVEWCDVPRTFPTLDACKEATGLTSKFQFSPTSGPIAGWDPSVYSTSWSDISLERPLSPVATMPAPVGTLARVAVLADATGGNTGVLVRESLDATRSRGSFTWIAGTVHGAINQVDSTQGVESFVPAVTYLPGRGVYLPASENFLLTSGDATNIPPLILVPSQIHFGADDPDAL